MSERPVQVPLRLRLYVSTATPESAAVETNLRRVCDGVGLAFEVEVLDVREHPDEAERDRIVLTPTLLRLTPPQLRVAGDLSNMEAAMDGLGLRVWGLSAAGTLGDGAGRDSTVADGTFGGGLAADGPDL
jgi:circadian clock protein KaiB